MKRSKALGIGIIAASTLAVGGVVAAVAIASRREDDEPAPPPTPGPGPKVLPIPRPGPTPKPSPLPNVDDEIPEFREGLAPVPSDGKKSTYPPAPKPTPPRPEPVPQPSDLYGNLPDLGYSDRGLELVAAASAVLGSSRGRQLVGESTIGDAANAITDQAFWEKFATKLGNVKLKLSPDNATHKPYIDAWVRMHGDVLRMLKAIPALAGGNPYKGNKTASLAWGTVALILAAASPISASSVPSRMVAAKSYLSQHPDMRKFVGQGSPSVRESGLLAEIAIRINAGKDPKPSSPWTGWAAAARAANRVKVMPP